MSLDEQRAVLFLQPDFDQTNTDDDVGAPLAYLKLGSAKEQADLSTARLRGDDLLTTAGLTASRSSKFFIDDMRESACSSSADDADSSYRQPTHYDALHTSSDGLDATLSSPSTSYYRSTADGSTTSTDTRTELSAELIGDDNTDARGGWRDHSDGNRITTVRGDRVDVVFGNYKRVVLGRVSGNEVGPTSYEASGGHIFARTSANHLQQYAIEHVEEADISGETRWKVVERSTEGNAVYRYEGKTRAYYDGPTFRRRVGVDSSSDTLNPEITREHNYGAVNETVTGNSFSRSLTVNDYKEEETGSGAHDETTAALVIHKKRGSWSEMGFTFEENRRTALDVDARFFVGRGSYEAGGRREETLNGWMITAKAGMKVSAQIGPVARLHYGTRCRWLQSGSPWVRMLFAPLNLDVNIGIMSGHMTLLQIFSSVDHGEYKLGELSGSYVRANNAIGVFKKIAMQVEL